MKKRFVGVSMSQVNSQGLPVSQKFIEQREREKEYLIEIGSFLDRTHGLPWTDVSALEYRKLLVKYGMISERAIG